MIAWAILERKKWNKDREDTKLLTVPVPWNNIHIRVVCLKRGCRRLPWTNVPYCDIPIHRTGGKYMRFCRTPLHKFKFNRSCQNFLFERNVIFFFFFFEERKCDHLELKYTCRSSTLAECPTNGAASTFHEVPDEGSHKWIKFLQSPYKNEQKYQYKTATESQ